MTKIRVHNPCNSNTRYYRYYNLFWDKFTDYLKLHFDVEENRYYEFAHMGRFPVKLQKGNSDNFLLLECEYIIENLENNEFVIMSVSDELTHATINECKNKYLKKVLISQFLPKKIQSHIEVDYFHKYSPWQYFQAQVFDLEPFYTKRLTLDNLSNELYFKGTSLEDRQIIYKINDDILNKNFTPYPPHVYFNELINHKIALSVDGRGEFCYRDIECFAVGVPIIRFEYESVFYDDLIPNYHYISIPRPEDLKMYRMGDENHAKMLEQRYYEVINDVEFLNFISKNARQYYEKNCMLDVSINNTYNLLNLNTWI
jgi:hypothetical protein